MSDDFKIDLMLVILISIFELYYIVICNAYNKCNAICLRQIQDAMFGEGLNLVGWYHSHPNTSSNPSLADIEAQMAYQLLLKAPGNTYQPCVAVIVCEFDSYFIYFISNR